MVIRDVPIKNAAAPPETRNSGVRIIMPRGMGKTTRLLSLSEFHHTPILCKDDVAKRMILAKAQRWNYDIPEPYTAHDVVTGKLKSADRKKLLVDEADCVLQSIISLLSASDIRIVASTITSDGDKND